MTLRSPRKHILLLILATALLTGAIVWLCQPRPPALGGSTSYPYPLAWFQQEQPNEAGKAYVRLYTHEPVVQAERGTPTATPVWRYAIHMKEENGIGFTIQHMDYVFFSGQEILMADSQTQDVLHEGLVSMSTYIGPTQYRHLNHFMSADPVITGLGLALFGTDDNGSELSFHIYLPFENKYK